MKEQTQFPQFRLPGFTLPLNFCPGEGHTTSDPVEDYSAEDEAGKLWPNALNRTDCYDCRVAY
jgi:hypothetical protein